ncbi:MAG: Asp23/Gls24 family envelope stress response protein [Clostridia bacterium]
MKVFALVGASGTGKSYHATSFAADKNIDYIIDDGLLISGHKVIAGFSAKKEITKIGAIRRALFMDPGHAEEVRNALQKCHADKLLILGTSRSMADRIAKNLNLPQISEYISIEEIASPREIHLARRMRMEEGKHIIPVPTFEIKKDFSGYFIHPLRIFQKGKNRDSQYTEKTVVRPTYSYMGRYYISDLTVEAIAQYNCMKVEGIHRVIKSRVASYKDGVLIDLDVSLIYGRKIQEILKEAQKLVAVDVENLTGLNVLQVNLTARTIVMRAEDRN